MNKMKKLLSLITVMLLSNDSEISLMASFILFSLQDEILNF